MAEVDQEKNSQQVRGSEGKRQELPKAPKICNDPTYGLFRVAIVDAYIADGKPEPRDNWLYGKLIQSEMSVADLSEALRQAQAALAAAPAPEAKTTVSIEIYQHDWIPGFASFHEDGSIQEGASAHVVLNLGSLLAAVQEGYLDKKELPYMIAESLMHETIHCLESWAHVEFSEDRIEALLTEYRKKYSRDTVWEYTGAEPPAASQPTTTTTDTSGAVHCQKCGAKVVVQLDNLPKRKPQFVGCSSNVMVTSDMLSARSAEPVATMAPLEDEVRQPRTTSAKAGGMNESEGETSDVELKWLRKRFEEWWLDPNDEPIPWLDGKPVEADLWDLWEAFKAGAYALGRGQKG